MPVYNGAKFIAEAINSVINQSYDNWELIIINDGSTDDTEEIVKKFIDNRIKYFFQKNKGVSSARNRGLQEMQGEYFCFLDADDSLPYKSLEARYNVFVENPETSFVDGVVIVKDENLQNVIRTYFPKFKGIPWKELISLSDKCFFGPTWMVKNERISYKFEETLTHGEDLLFYISISANGIYNYTQETILFYRKGYQSAMTNLIGLEEGYKKIYKILKYQFKIEKLYFTGFKIKKIMFLSFLKNRQWKNAFKILLTYNYFE